MTCWCGHSCEWDHYKRTPGNGQQFDWVCPDCLVLRLSGLNVDAWHKPPTEVKP